MAVELKVGTVVVFSNADELEDVTNGKEYVIAGIDGEGDEYFIDDAGDRDYAAASGNGFWGLAGNGIFTIVAK